MPELRLLSTWRLNVGLGRQTMSRKDEITRRDEELLAQLGYKQEFKRAFTPLEARRPSKLAFAPVMRI